MIFLLVLTMTIFSCNNDDEISNEVNGRWNLVFVSCECEPVDLEIGEHIWTFDLEESELHVINNVTEPLHTIFETGTYNVTGSSNRITIQSVEYDYYFDNERMYLADHPESDGPLIEFVRD